MDLLGQVRSTLENAFSPTKPTQASPEPDQKDFATAIKVKLEECRKSPVRTAFESAVVTNSAYLLGFDGLQFDAKLKQFRSTNGGGSSKSKAYVNLILPTIQNRLSRLCKNPPRYDVPPNSNSQEDKDAARLSLRALNSKFDDEKVNEKRIELYMWMQQAGYSYIKTCWDPMRGKKISEVDDMGQPTGKFEREGDIAIDVVSPLEVFVDPLAKTLADAEWLIHAKIRKLSYFRNQYPDRGGQVKQEDSWLMSLQNLSKINNMTNRGASSNVAQEMKDAAIEIAYYEKPSRQFPEGRFAVVANGVILAYKDLQIDEIPFAKFDDVKIGGKFNSESIITHLRPLQDQYNRNMRRKAEFLNKGLNLKFMAPKGSGLIAEAINDSTELYEYNPVPQAKPPEAVQSPQLPQYVYTDQEQLESKFNEISGINDVSKGQMPSASIPGIGMQILQEADETRIGIITESNENSWCDVGRHVLKYMDAYYKNPRFLREAGQDNEYTITKFTNEDLKGHTDPKVIRASTLPNSKVMKRQDILNAYQQGLLGDIMDPNVKRKVLAEIEFGDINGIWEDQVIDDAQIKRTIDEMEAGEQPEFHRDDNHQAHFDYKNRYRKTEKFLSLDPQIQQVFLQDLENHKMALMPPEPMPVGPDGQPLPVDPNAMPIEPEQQAPLMGADQGMMQ